MSLSLREAFDLVVELERTARAAVYREHGLSSKEIDELERLVAAEREEEEPAPVLELERVLLRPPLAGATLGCWRLVEPLGRGGMGVVWRAVREDGRVEQTVAIKLLDQPLDPTLNARIALERTILARLDHPGIGRFIDAGENAEGHPYFAMELIEGMAIDQWADSQKIGVRGRVIAVVSLLEALAHAHAQLIVHRDLKCSNVLVTAGGQPKLIDFGIARNLGNNSDTRAYGRFLTLRNAAPEQLLGETVGTGVDIYGAGLVLYELLCGLHPFAGDYTRSGELEQRILDESPLVPSKALQRLQRSNPELAHELASRRGLAHAGALATALAGDLDAIVGKALSKGAAERYSTADAFAADLRRWLEGHPVQVRRASSWYRLRKFVGRHRLAVTASSIFVLGLLGLSAALWQARIVAGEARESAEQTVEFLVGVFAAGNPEENFGKPPSAVELLDHALASLPRAADAGRTQAAFSLAIAQTLLGLGEPLRALTVLDPQLLERADAATRERLELTRVQATLEAGNPKEAGQLLTRARAAGTWVQERSELQAQLLELKILRASNRSQESLASAEQLRALLAADEQLDKRWQLRMQQEATWALLDDKTISVPADYARLEQILKRQLASLGPQHPDLVETQRQLAKLDRRNGRFELARSRLQAALAITEQVYGKDHLQTARVLNSIANLESDQGNRLAALAITEQALQILMARLGAQHPATTMLKLNVAMQTHVGGGQPARALELLAEVRTAALQHWPVSGSNFAVMALTTAAAQADLGLLDESEQSIQEVLAVERPPTILAWALAVRAQVAHARSQHEVARSLLQQALPDMQKRPEFFGAYLQRALRLAQALGLEHGSTPEHAAEPR